MDSSRELRRNLSRFVVISLCATALGAIGLRSIIGNVYEQWITLGYFVLGACVLAIVNWIVVKEERGKLSDAQRASLNRYFEDGWPIFVVMIPVFLGSIVRGYFPSLTGLLTLPLGILLLGTMIWAWQHRRESKLRRRS
ncbi:MAG: hypothetical protein M3441_25495 [Chloroflexota bacterium]|nr:hypothetical protein [Chloroflexota bacterium]